MQLTQEIVTRLNLINFALKPETLEKQLLDLVYKTEYKDKFDNHQRRVREIRFKRNQVSEKEQHILSLLISEIDFLRDKHFKEQLTECKSLKEVYENEQMSFDGDERGFRENKNMNDRVAKLGTKLYFILYELSKINHMYQFSIMNFLDIFKTNLESF